MICQMRLAGYSYHTKPFQIGDGAKKPLDCYLIRFQSEGVCHALVNGKMERVEAGDWLFYKPGDAYYLVVEEDVQPSGETAIASGDYFFRCSGEWLDEWWKQQQPKQKVTLPHLDSLLTICRQTVLEFWNGRQTSRQIVDYYVRILCLTLQRETAIYKRSPEAGHSFLAQRMRNFVERHTCQPFKLEELAKSVGLSESRAAHLFKECFGQTVMQYALQLRLTLAHERMLYSNLSLEQIAATSGFSSYSYFHRMFRAAYQMSPKQYRLHYTKKPSDIDDIPL